MIDLILLSFYFGVFYGGFYCGKKFGTLKATGKAAHTWVSGLFD